MSRDYRNKLLKTVIKRKVSAVINNKNKIKVHYCGNKHNCTCDSVESLKKTPVRILKVILLVQTIFFNILQAATNSYSSYCQLISLF